MSQEEIIDEEQGNIGSRDGYKLSDDNDDDSNEEEGDYLFDSTSSSHNHEAGNTIIPAFMRHNSSLSANSSDTASHKDERLDHVSELTPLMATGDRAARALSPSMMLRPIQRSLSEESIATIAALPDMVLRAHSIHVGGAGRHSEVTCSFRPSSAKAALKAVQQEQRASRRRAEQKMASTSDDSPTKIRPSFVMKESYWIDIETPPRSSDELSEFLYQLRLPSFFVSILSEPTTWTSEVVALQFISLAIFQILPVNPDSDEIAHVALLSMPRLLVTFSTFPKNEDASDGLYNLVHQYMKQRERVPEPSSSGLLLAWRHFHVRRTSAALRKLRVRAVEMDN